MVARAESLKGHLDMLLLAAVSRERAHGYGLVVRLRGLTGGVLDLPEGTIYPALYRLERAGLVRSEWATVAGRRRRLYDLTVRGRDALRGQVGDWRRFAGAVDAVVEEARLG
ncbi:MAG TPA: helix-turn-helix transcriptional regulator [Candidatus Dormibacteraeota bacterium]|nr:helix-turn-helix transcriptional regulator [Candidatus Dormibacteraeota bacterium]